MLAYGAHPMSTLLRALVAGSVVLMSWLLATARGLVVETVPYGDSAYEGQKAIETTLRLVLLPLSRSDVPAAGAGWARWGLVWAGAAALAVALAPLPARRIKRALWVRRGGHVVVFGGGARLAYLLDRGFFEGAPGARRILQVLTRRAEWVAHRHVLPVWVPAPKEPADWARLAARTGVEVAACLLFVNDDDEITLDKMAQFLNAKRNIGTGMSGVDRWVDALEDADRAGEDAALGAIGKAIWAASARTPTTRGHLLRPHFWRALADRLTAHPSSAGTGDGERLPYRLFSLPALEAKNILSRFPPGRVRHPDEARHGPQLVIVGFDERAEAILLEWLLRGHRAERGPPGVTVVAVDADRYRRELLAAYPEIVNIGPLSFVEGDPRRTGDAERIAELFMDGAPIELVVVTSSRVAAQALREDLDRRRSFRPAVVVWTDGIRPTPLDGEAFAPVRLAELEAKTIERQAQRIHNLYLLKSFDRIRRENRPARDDARRKARRAKIAEKPTLTAWWELTEGIREDNRRQAEHLELKARDLGARILSRQMGGSASPRPQTLFEGERVERVAETEHRRWEASRYVDGWRFGKRDDGRKRHPNLVPYEQLDEATKDHDRAFVRGLALTVEAERSPQLDLDPDVHSPNELRRERRLWVRCDRSAPRQQDDWSLERDIAAWQERVRAEGDHPVLLLDAPLAALGIPGDDGLEIVVGPGELAHARPHLDRGGTVWLTASATDSGMLPSDMETWLCT